MGWDWKVIATGSGLPFPSWLPAPSLKADITPLDCPRWERRRNLGVGWVLGEAPSAPSPGTTPPPRGSASTKASFPRGEGAAGNSGRSLLPAQPAREALIQ